MDWTKNFKRLPYFIDFFYEKTTTSIAFYPTLFAIFSIFLTALMLFLEEKGLTGWVAEHAPGFLMIKSWDVAESVLTMMVGALISLMVFSFSMVMVLLNNAASNYSPRILPSLIANKFHQVVLGTYLGSITYSLLLIINLTPTQSDTTVPSISVLLAIFFGLHCLMIFVFFIHSISEAVQVGKILESLSSITEKKMENGMISKLINEPAPDTRSWKVYKSDRSGYLKAINCEIISKLCIEHELKIKVLIATRTFVVNKIDLFCCDKALEEDLQNKILEQFRFSENEVAEDDHAIGFKQINEIALKAMSPGINDPGTALYAINHLAILFDKKMERKDAEAFPIKNEKNEVVSVRLWLTITDFEELLCHTLASLRTYARHDMMVLLRMLDMLKFLIKQDSTGTDYKKVIRLEIEKIRMDAKEHLTNPEDYKKIVESIDLMKKERQGA